MGMPDVGKTKVGATQRKIFALYLREAGNKYFKKEKIPCVLFFIMPNFNIFIQLFIPI